MAGDLSANYLVSIKFSKARDCFSQILFSITGAKIYVWILTKNVQSIQPLSFRDIALTRQRRSEPCIEYFFSYEGYRESNEPFDHTLSYWENLFARSIFLILYEVSFNKYQSFFDTLFIRYL